MRVTGWDEQGIRAAELVTHPFFVITLFQHERAALEGVRWCWCGDARGAQIKQGQTIGSALVISGV